MERIDIAAKGRALFSKYKYVMLIVCIGILLMCLPGKAQTDQIPETVPLTEAPVSRAQELEEVLGQIAGVGKIKVLLTESDSAETIYQTDEDHTHTQDSDTKHVKTVIVTTSGREESGLIRSITPPVYLGAIIVCQGGDLPSVRLSIVQAVSNVTGIPSDRISVLKMK